MSTSEYYDLFLTSQQNGKYHIFVFDIKNSKKMNKESRQIAAIKTEKLMLKIYNTIKEIEIKTKKKYLL